PQYVTALWMGYDRSTEENYLTGGSSYPTILTKKILTDVDQYTSLTAQFTKPNEVDEVMQPIQLPELNDVKGTIAFGGLNIIRGKLKWTSTNDERIVYRIYKVKDDIDERIGEVVGKDEFIINNIALFKTEYYYVVPFDPVTQLEGIQSNIVPLSL